VSDEDMLIGGEQRFDEEVVEAAVAHLLRRLAAEPVGVPVVDRIAHGRIEDVEVRPHPFLAEDGTDQRLDRGRPAVLLWHEV
jgi:hypothetical protein